MRSSAGNGKMHLAAAAANTLVARGRSVLFATAPELLAMIRDGFDAGQAEDLTEACQRRPSTRFRTGPGWWWTTWGRSG